MKQTKDYLTLKGWKADLGETARDFKDIGILVKRALGLSNYGLKKWGGEMTHRELEDFCFQASALWFANEQEFQIYGMTHKLPLGRCIIGYGKNAKKYDDTLIPKKEYTQILESISAKSRKGRQ